MGKLEKALLTLDALDRAAEGARFVPDARCCVVVTLVYLVSVISLPLEMVDRLVWMAVYPVLWATVGGIGYGRLLARSLYLLPVVAVVGLLNPLIDRREAFIVLGVTVSRGWVSFAAIAIRGLLSVQAVLALVSAVGFRGVCRALGALGVPAVLTTQMWMVYRYVGVLLSEALTMSRARRARGYGSDRLRPSMWAAFIGQLMLSSFSRAERVNRAMLARGYTGSGMRPPEPTRWRPTDTLWLVAWLAVFLVLRFAPMPWAG